MKIIVVLFFLPLLVITNYAYAETPSNDKVEEVISRLSDEDVYFRKEAVKELGNLGNLSAINALNDLWNEEMDEEVSFEIEIAISKLKLLDADPKVRIDGIGALGEKAESRLSVDATSGNVEGGAFFKIVAVDDNEAEVILSLLSNSLNTEENQKVKEKINVTINKFKLSDNNPDIRKEAADFFGERADPDNLIFLGRALDKEEDVSIKANLKEAMSKIESKEKIAIALKQLFNGLTVSSQYLLIAIGLAITFGVMGIINLAHGEFMMLGCYVALMVQRLFASCFSESVLGLYFILALPLSFLFTAGVGYLLERSVIRFLYGRALDTLLATWGVSLIIQQVVRNVFGANNIDVRSPDWLQGGLSVFAGLFLPYKRLFIVGFTAFIICAVYWLFYRTRLGLRIRAVMQNREMSNCLGISSKSVNSFTFALGSGLAGVAGCNMSLLGSVGPTTGQNYIVDCFMVVVLGGVGKIVGTVYGAFGLGETNAILEFFTTANVGKALAFLLVIVFLRFRPTGFCAQTGREDVRMATH